MTDDTANIILEHLRHIRAKVDRTADDMADIKPRVSNLEGAFGRLTVEIGHMREDMAGLHVRMDRIERRLDRIEQRLDLADQP